MDYKTLEQLIVQNKPQINKKHQQDLLRKLESQFVKRESGWNLKLALKYSLLCILLFAILLPFSLKLTKAIAACGLEQGCIVKHITSTNIFGDPVTLNYYTDGGKSIDSPTLTKEHCIALMDIMKAQKVDETPDKIHYLLPSGHKTACYADPESGAGNWNYAIFFLNTLEQDQIYKIINGELWSELGPAISDGEYYYQIEPKIKISDEQIAKALKAYGAVHLEDWDECSYYSLPNAPSYRLGWCPKRQVVTIFEADGPESLVKTDKIFADLINFIEKSQ